MRVSKALERYGPSLAVFLQSLGVQPILPNSNIWFVDENAANASDSNDGIHGDSWETPFATIAYAIARNNGSHTGNDIENVIDWGASPWWKTNNIICIAPSEYTETLTSLPYACTMVGCGGGYGTEGSVQIKSTTGAAAAGSLIGATLLNLHFETSATYPVLDLGTFNSSTIKNCVFHNGGTATHGISIETSTRGRILDCDFGTGDTKLTHGIYVGGGTTNKKFYGMRICNNRISAGTAGIYCAAEYLTGETVIDNNIIWYPAKGIDIDTSSPVCVATRNMIMASSDCIEGMNAALTTGNQANAAGTTAWEDAI